MSMTVPTFQCPFYPNISFLPARFLPRSHQIGEVGTRWERVVSERFYPPVPTFFFTMKRKKKQGVNIHIGERSALGRNVGTGVAQ